MIKAIVLTGLAAVAVAQYPQQQAAAPQGAPYSFSSSVNHAAGPAGPQQGYAAPQQGYAAPQQSYAAPPAPPAAAGGYNPGAYQQAGAGQFGNINQIASQNPAFSIQVPQGHEQPAYGGAPQPAPGAYAAPQQYAAPQSYGAPQAAAAGGANPYGGPFSYSSSVSHAVPQGQPQAQAAPPAHSG